MSTRRTVGVLLVAACLLLAGCSGDGGGENPSVTDTTRVPTTDATTTDAPPSTTASTTTATPSGPDVDAAALRSKALDSLAGVDTARFQTNVSQNVVSGAVNRTVTVNGTVRLNRTARELAVQRTARGPAGSAESAQYLVGETVYTRSRQNVQAYGSEWTKLDVSENFSRTWRSLDDVAIQRELLNASEVSLAGTESVDGTETYRLQLALSPDDLSSVAAFNASTVAEIRATYWVRPDDGSLVQSRLFVNATSTVQGQSFVVRQTVVRRMLETGQRVTVTLPEGAENAVSVGDDG